MKREIFDYLDLLENFKQVNRPIMPKFNLSAYTDNEYVNAIKSVNDDFENIDDFNVYMQYLKGD